MSRAITELRPCDGCPRLKKANRYRYCRPCSTKHRHGADFFHRMRQRQTAVRRDVIVRRQERFWRERFPGVPPQAARRIYLQGYRAGEALARARVARAAANGGSL